MHEAAETAPPVVAAPSPSVVGERAAPEASSAARVHPDAASDDWRHRPVLDGIRAIGILLVLVHHTYSNLVPIGTTGSDPVPGAFIGVDVFFALSGFLITSLLLREHQRRGSVSLRSFYARRALRLLPALYVLIAAYVVYSLVTDQSIPAIGVLPVATYWQNWAGAIQIPVGFTHLWSLAVEEQFYLVWPVLVMVLLARRRTAGVFVTVLLALLVAMNAYRILAWRGPISVFTFYVQTPTHGDGLIVGALAAYFWSKGGVVPRRVLVPAAWISVCFLGWCVARYGAADRFYYFGGFTLVGIATCVLIIASLQTSWLGSRVFAWRPLCIVGLVSYGLYLWHYPIFLAVQRYSATWPLLVRITVAFALTAAATAASWWLVEGPFLRWKRRFAASGARST